MSKGDNQESQWARYISYVLHFAGVRVTTTAAYGNLSVRLPDSLYAATQVLADRQHCLARDVHTQAVRSLLAARAAGAAMAYLPSTKDARQRTIWLDKDLCEAAKKAADEDRVSKTTFILTALTRFARQGAGPRRRVAARGKTA